MIKKSRVPSKELIIFRSLNARTILSDQQKWQYTNLEKGFEGEVKFDLMTEKLQSECFVINGLLLEFNNSEFQIDTCLIFQKNIYLIDVKNFEGDYYYDSEKLYLSNGNEAKDPLLQLKRCESLFRQLLQNLGYQFHVEAHLVFINPEFTLLQAPRSFPIVHPTQLNSFMKKLNTIPSKLNSKHEKLANQLLSLDKKESSNMRFPAYNYDQSVKGAICSTCHSLSTFVTGNILVCGECGQQEGVDSAILRTVWEMLLLFPDRKITTSGVYEWVRIVGSKKTIRRVLLKHFKSVGKTTYRYFVE